MRLIDLSPIALLAVAVFSICCSGLFALLIFAPRRDCFFLRLRPEGRLLTLMAVPFLLILWPLVLLHWLIRSGLFPDDPDFFDD